MEKYSNAATNGFDPLAEVFEVVTDDFDAPLSTALRVGLVRVAASSSVVTPVPELASVSQPR